MAQDENILKDAFAAALLRQPNDPFRAALTIFGTNVQRALQVSQQWIADLYVLSKQAELLEKLGEDAFLPSKAMTAHRIWEMAEGARDIKDRTAAYKLYSEVRGFIEKPNAGTTNNLTINQNRVMIMRDHGTDDEWELSAANQQMKLVSNARN